MRPSIPLRPPAVSWSTSSPAWPRSSGLEAAKARGASLGRPTVWTPQRAEAAEALLTAGATVTEVAQALNVSRATVYRHANPPKTVPTRTCPHH